MEEFNMEMIQVNLPEKQIDLLTSCLWDFAKKSHKELNSTGNNVYAIFDGAKNPDILTLLNDTTLKHRCLFSGELSDSVLRAAPHLVQLEQDNIASRELIRLSWGKNWGIFVITDPTITLESVRDHCRRISRVVSPQRKPLFFRYYDPSVLNAILPVCNRTELQTLFGPFLYVLSGVSTNPDPGWSVYLRQELSGQFSQCELSQASDLPPAAAFTPFKYHPFKLRQEHMNAAAKKQDHEFFIKTYESYLRCYEQSTQTVITIDEEEYGLQAYLWRCYSKAAEFKLESVYSLIVFYDLAVSFGWGFWEKPEYSEINRVFKLERPEEFRIAKIENLMSAQLIERLWS